MPDSIRGNNDALIQALMIQLIYRMRTVYWNVNQSSWNQECHNCAEWFVPTPIELGSIKVTVDTSEYGDAWATFSFDGIRVTTELSNKRLFQYGVHEPILTDAEWVAWFNNFLSEVDRLDDEWFRARHERYALRPENQQTVPVPHRVTRPDAG